MKHKTLEFYSRKYGPFVILGLLFVVSIVPLLLRGSDSHPVTPGSESYLYLRQADLLLEGTVGYDPIRNEQIFTTPYIILLAIFRLFGFEWALGSILAGAFVWLLYHYLKKEISKKFVIYSALSFVIISPVFSILSTRHEPFILAAVLFLLSLIYRYKSLALSMICLAIGSVVEPLFGLLFGLFLLADFTRLKRYPESLGVLLALVIPLLWQFIWLGDLKPIPKALEFNHNLFFEFGLMGGISIFFVLLAAYGVWSKRIPKRKTLLWSTLGLFVLSMFLTDAIFVTTIILSLLISYALFELIVDKWELELIRAVSVILVMCVGILLMTLSIKDRISALPDENIQNVFTFVGEERHGGSVLTLPEYAPLVEYYSKRKAILSESVSAHSVNEAFLSREPEQVYGYLESTGTGYIYIDEMMRSKLFSRSDEGILFVLPNTKRFVELGNFENGKVWYYIKR